MSISFLVERISKTPDYSGVFDADILLGVGLPIDIYGAQKYTFRQYFLRDDIRCRFEKTKNPNPFD
jgi:plasmid segregation protein ParM